MSLKIYDNFEQIDRDLQILELERKIEFEKMKMDIEDVKRSFSPITMVTNALGSIGKNALILKLTNKLIGK
ncbi:DUF6327 family protein [Nonlabens agnitus]|uniref:DUF6327 family protein n=1 Tax=Nonlabens agnitus TaxID=870484 RepID=UPI001F5B0E4E|nr:DUF6327 family protein [Nonlabens agnitus]